MSKIGKYLLIYFLLALPFFSGLSFGQKPVFGIKIGCSISDAEINYGYWGSNGWTIYSKLGLLAGVYADIPLSKKFIFRPEAIIVDKGAKEKDADLQSDSYSIPFAFIDFPLNILFRKDFAKGHLLAGAGPVISLPIKRSYSDYSSKAEFSVNGLIGYEIAIGLSLSVNYTYGLSDLSKGLSYAAISKITNGYLGISVGYSF